MTAEKRWPSDWVRAVLPICILQVIAGNSEAYGYQIIHALKAAGFDGLSGGTVYPALNRLETDGSITSEWREGSSGPGKKFYYLTSAGRQRLTGAGADWRDFAELIDHFLQAKKG